jgi:hypothetical protein
MLLVTTPTMAVVHVVGDNTNNGGNGGNGRMAMRVYPASGLILANLPWK